MTGTDLKLEIAKRLGYVVRTFGGIDNFLDTLSEKHNYIGEDSYYRVVSDLHTLVSHRDNINIISAWANIIDLTEENYNTFSNNAIILEEPYKVFNTQGDLLYSVYNHNGVYGKSILDKQLLLQSKNTDIYYLQYCSYSSEVYTRLLLVNHQSTAPAISTTYLKTDISSTKYTTINQIVLTWDLAPASYSLYFIPSSPIRIKDRLDNIVEYPSAIKIDSEGPTYKTILFSPEESGWIIARLSIYNPSLKAYINTYLNFSNITGLGEERFLVDTESPNMAYVTLNNVKVAQKALSKTSLNDSIYMNLNVVLSI